MRAVARARAARRAADRRHSDRHFVDRISMNAPDPAPLRLTQFSHGGGCGCKIAPARAAADPRQGRPVRAPEGAAGRHRDVRRRRRLPAERAAGDRRDDRLLHADRRRPVRLRRDRRDQRDLRRLRDGRHAALRAGARRHADRQAAGRDDPPHPRRRRGGLRDAPAFPIAGGHTIDSVEPIYGLVVDRPRRPEATSSATPARSPATGSCSASRSASASTARR